MKLRLCQWFLLLPALLAAGAAQAEDTDLFAWVNEGVDNVANVLLIVDNGASFSASETSQRCGITTDGVVTTTGVINSPTNLDRTSGAIEQCALYQAVNALEVNTGTNVKLNIGVMMFNGSGMKQFNASNGTFSNVCNNNQSGGEVGGCLAVPMGEFTQTFKDNLLDWIRRWETSGNSDYNVKSNNLANGAIMQEAFAYMNGRIGMSGRNYSGMWPTGGCGKANIIFIGNAYRNNASPQDNTTGASPLGALNGTLTPAGKRSNPVPTSDAWAPVQATMQLNGACGVNSHTLQTAENSGALAINWAAYLRNYHEVTTFGIGIQGPNCNRDYVSNLMKLGELGGGGYIGADNYEELTAAITGAISKIMSVNSVFAAVSLPVSVNTQGSYLNQVYVGMFRPAASFKPRWSGNLKQYKLGFNSQNTDLQLQDADSKAAINNLTGFVTECARSFWTPSTVDDYWSQQQAGGCTTIQNSKSSNYPDGNIVEKGAHAHTLRAMTSSRVVKTCASTMSGCSSLTNFDTSNAALTSAALTPASTTALTATETTNLINWARGVNVQGELSKAATAIRPSVHGDVVHSRPVAVNHGGDAADQRKVVVYYGSNDGMLHAINGNRDTSADFGGTSYAPGAELWSFMPPEFYKRLKRLYDNQEHISFPNTPATDHSPKDYGMDGPITAFKGRVGGSTKTVVIATMRRGGRSVYAFDVTDPASPVLLWRKGCASLTDDSDCSSGFSGIGQTWASAKVMYASGYSESVAGVDTPKPLLIMGGGYDSCEDYDGGLLGANHNCTASSKGKKVYVLDAATGAVVRAFDTAVSNGVARGVLADATLVVDGNGLTQYAYTADLGGNVYRLSFAGTTAEWTMTRVASLGCDSTATCTRPRKFMFQPSVVKVPDANQYNIMLGSGDREKPVEYYQASKSVQNYFFMVKDEPSNTTFFDSESVTCGGTFACLGSLVSITGDSTTVPSTKKGWALPLAASEQVVTSAVTVFGSTHFSTHQPAVATPDACSTNLGSTLLYKVDYSNGNPIGGSRYEDVSGDGLPPSPVAGQVELDDGTIVPFCIGCSKDSPLEASIPNEASSIVQPKSRLYWYIQK